MTDIAVAGHGPLGPAGLVTEVTRTVRAPEIVLWDQPTATATFRFTPDLSAAEQAAFADTLATLRTRDVQLTTDEYAAIKPHLATLRTFQQQSQAEFMAKSAAERDRELFGVVTALLRTVRSLLRD